MASLEERIKEQKASEKPDWKQWIPVYGIKLAMDAAYEMKPSLATGSKEHPLRYCGSMVYHGITTLGVIFGSGYVVSILLEKIS